MEIRKFTVKEKDITLYATNKGECPLVILNTYTGNGSSVVEKLNEIHCYDHNLLVIGNLKWDHDMTPWYCQPLSENDTPCTGGADEYLDLLLSEILPKAKELIKGTPAYIGIVGYSLAGLFALYTLYKCNIFERAASLSGSLWFPKFKDYVSDNSFKGKPKKVYLSLGDKEAKTKHQYLRTVQDNTEFIAKHYRQLGVDTEFELNQGDHFKDAALRSAKGIKAILNQ